MAKSKVKITGLKKLRLKLKKAIEKRLPIISGKVYRDLVIENLQPSKKTGALIKSWKVKSRVLKAIVSSDLPYAAIQHYGGRIRITEKMRSKMWILYKQTGLPVYKAIAITKKGFITIPAKKYLDVQDRKLSKRIDVEFNKTTKRI